MKINTNVYELCLYFTIWIWANFYSLKKLYEEQMNIMDSNKNLVNSLPDLNPGWKLLSKLKDTSDTEWNIWKYFFSKICHFLTANFILSELIRLYSSQIYLKIWYFMSSALFIYFQMGLKFLLVFMIKPIFHLIIIFVGGNVLSLWLASVVSLIIYSTDYFFYNFWDFLDYESMNDNKVYLTMLGLAWIELRCISYSVDFINQSKEQDVKINHAKNEKRKVQFDMWLFYQEALNLYSYVFYLPLLYTGPIVLYEEFEKSFKVPHGNWHFTEKMKKFLIDMVLFSCYSFFLEASLHFIYFNALQSDLKTLSKLPLIALSGGGLWMGLEFHMKYTITYGVAAAFTRLDNIDPPPTPRCISRIHVYSQMWRYFDVGLYKFLVKYIYKPNNSIITKNTNLPQTVCQLLSSLSTFIFIYVWHGIRLNIFIWSLLNFIGISIEFSCRAISRTETYNKFKLKVLKTSAMETRFIAFLCSPLLIMSAISNVYLFAGTEVGNLFFSSIIKASMSNLLAIFVSMYCCCHVSIALEDFPSRTDRKQLKRCI